jgi:(2Fe-2S) ferredoxin
MKTLADLQKIREQVQKQMKVREGEQRGKIVVAMGTCGIASGARETMSAILDELEKQGVSDVTVTQTGCKGICDKEPVVDVAMPGQPTVTYGLVTPERARAIVNGHVIGGEIQSDWVIAQQD